MREVWLEGHVEERDGPPVVRQKVLHCAVHGCVQQYAVHAVTFSHRRARLRRHLDARTRAPARPPPFGNGPHERLSDQHRQKVPTHPLPLPAARRVRAGDPLRPQHPPHHCQHRPEVAPPKRKRQLALVRVATWQRGGGGGGGGASPISGGARASRRGAPRSGDGVWAHWAPAGGRGEVQRPGGGGGPGPQPLQAPVQGGVVRGRRQVALERAGGGGVGGRAERGGDQPAGKQQRERAAVGVRAVLRERGGVHQQARHGEVDAHRLEDAPAHAADGGGAGAGVRLHDVVASGGAVGGGGHVAEGVRREERGAERGGGGVKSGGAAERRQRGDGDGARGRAGLGGSRWHAWLGWRLEGGGRSRVAMRVRWG
eukprot:1192029-Prorocentrum_minimum.AAC.3